MKIHIQPFRSIAYNISEIFCVIPFMKHAFEHLKCVHFITFSDLVQYKYAKVRFKNFPFIGCNVKENLCESVDKYLYYLNRFSQETCYCESE